jgi:hypothetical protein
LTCADAGALRAALGHLALIHCLRTLEQSPGRLSLRVRVYREGVTAPREIEPPIRDGVPELHEGDLFTISVTNRHSEPVYVSLFDVDGNETRDPARRLNLLTPPTEQEGIVIRPGQEVEFFAKTKLPVSAEKHAGRHTLKVVATNVAVDFAPLLDPGQRGPADPITHMHAVAAERRAGLDWAAATLVVDVR